VLLLEIAASIGRGGFYVSHRFIVFTTRRHIDPLLIRPYKRNVNNTVPFNSIQAFALLSASEGMERGWGVSMTRAWNAFWGYSYEVFSTHLTRFTKIYALPLIIISMIQYLSSVPIRVQFVASASTLSMQRLSPNYFAKRLCLYVFRRKGRYILPLVFSPSDRRIFM